MREVSTLRPLLPEAISASDIVDGHRGPIIRRLLRIARTDRRAVALAARRGIPLWGDTPAQRFDLLFIEREPRASWLLGEDGRRIAWLGGHDTIAEGSAFASFPMHFNAMLPAKADPAITRALRDWRAMRTEAIRRRKPIGRPAGRRDASPRLIPGHSRATHEQLARQVQHARTILHWNGARVFREAEMMNNLQARHLFTDATRALLATIGRHATRLEVLRRIADRFRRHTVR